MAARLVIAPEAEQDIAEAYAWYEGRRVGLGEEFLSSVDACLEAIRRAPEMYGVIHERIQRSLVPAFLMRSSSSTRRELRSSTPYFTLPAIPINGVSVILEPLALDRGYVDRNENPLIRWEVHNSTKLVIDRLESGSLGMQAGRTQFASSKSMVVVPRRLTL
jgi:hypothetical protein